MSTVWLGENSSNNKKGMQLITRYEHQNYQWAYNQISISGNYVTLNSGFINSGNSIVLMPYSGYRMQDCPAGLQFGLTYYTQQVTGNTFRVSTDYAGSSLKSITSTGTANGWYIEMPDYTQGININNLKNEKAVRVVIKNGGTTGSYGQIAFQINGVSSNNYTTYGGNYYYGNTFMPILYSSQCPFRIVGIYDIICENSYVVFNGNSNTEYPATSTATYGANNTSITNGISAVNSAFSNGISSINITFGNQMLIGDFTVEVYRI